MSQLQIQLFGIGGVVMEVALEILIDVVFDVYDELLQRMLPKGKHQDTLCMILGYVIAFVIVLGIIALFVWGIALVVRKNMLGFLPLGIAVILLVLQIVMGVRLRRAKKNKEKR